VSDLFDMKLRAMRRGRAARFGPELFLAERLFDDCLERISLTGRRYQRALLIGCPDARWPERLRSIAADVDVRDPGPVIAAAAGGEPIDESAWDPTTHRYDLVLAIGTLDTVNDLPLVLHRIRRAIESDGLFIGVIPGGDTLPQLRRAMRAADAVAGGASPHVHPRIEASALAPLLETSGFERPVVDVERVSVSYRTLDKLVADLRAMAATNVLLSRPPRLTRAQKSAADKAFRAGGDGERTIEVFELLHFAAWTARTPDAELTL
jgi:NADH dehydrogenase [ubiquinone] 1 alpha subcomplex assembly factor 5